MSTPPGPPGTPSEPSTLLVSEWAGYGIAVAAARFIPVPLLDDLVRERATRLAVARTLRSHGRRRAAGSMEVLYTGANAPGSALIRRLRSVPRRILLFPVRKYVAIFGSVRGVPTDVMTVLLLGRALHRHLARGGLPDTQPPDLARAEALALRRAFDATLQEMDLRLLAGALAGSLSAGRRLTGAAVRHARRLATRGDTRGDTGGDTRDADAKQVHAAAGDVAEVMRRRDIADLLHRFDATLDARLGAGRPSPR